MLASLILFNSPSSNSLMTIASNLLVGGKTVGNRRRVGTVVWQQSQGVADHSHVHDLLIPRSTSSAMLRYATISGVGVAKFLLERFRASLPWDPILGVRRFAGKENASKQS